MNIQTIGIGCPSQSYVGKMVVKLNSKQYEYLERNLSIEKPELFKFFSTKGNFVFEIDGDIAVEVRNWVSERMQLEGFDINYELSESGIILEQMEDLLYE